MEKRKKVNKSLKSSEPTTRGNEHEKRPTRGKEHENGPEAVRRPGNHSSIFKLPPKPGSRTNPKSMIAAKEALDRVQAQIATGKSWKRARSESDNALDRILMKEGCIDPVGTSMAIDANPLGRPPDN